MSAFWIFAICLTTAYAIYYTVTILLDLNGKTKEKLNESMETFELKNVPESPGKVVEETVLYFKIYGVVFIYHNVTRNSKAQLFSEAAEQSPIVWPGVRLQRFPVELWELSMESSHRP